MAVSLGERPPLKTTSGAMELALEKLVEADWWRAVAELQAKQGGPLQGALAHLGNDIRLVRDRLQDLRDSQSPPAPVFVTEGP